ncbi:hypothetical protein ACIBG0_04940 [Nocardia sp. NPDC050630]|uniref:hypothetical protein n=1 Tax=Nocardia sp. NPDC050630 TaxID=3364321 RepID=UPI003787BFE1
MRSLDAQRLIVAGPQTNVCVEATVRAGLETAFTTPNYGRDTAPWIDPATASRDDDSSADLPAGARS